MKPSFLTQQTKEYLYQEIEKLPGIMPAELAVQMYELVLEFCPDKIVYHGDKPERPEMAYSAGLIQNGTGAFYRTGKAHDIAEIHSIDILHTDYPDNDISRVNQHGYVLSVHPIKNCKLVRTVGDYKLYCNRPYN